MDKIVKLFGEKVVGKCGDVKTADLCGDKKLIGVYFSAHWCPPCRTFTPHLAKKYDVWKKAGKQFEVIFVSSDRDQKNFDDYYKEMPWLTIPYEDEDKRMAKGRVHTDFDGLTTIRDCLSETFEVEGIPTLVIMDGKTGAVITEDATGDVGESDEFPTSWNTDPVNIPELVGPKVKGKDGKDVETSSFTGEGKVIALYFSAHWCPPCKGFTPVLAEKYKKWKEGGANFEIVFISSDRDQKSFDEYYAEMPWLAMDFADRDRKGQCSSKFGVSGIPTLIILDGNTGEIITKDGRAKVMAGDDYPDWKA